MDPPSKRPGHEDKLRWSSPGVRWSVGWLAALVVGAGLVGFVWLPSVHRDFSAQGLWDSLCRAAGVPSAWARRQPEPAGPSSTRVVLEPAMGRAGAPDAVGRGATLALNCTMCHGAQGMSSSSAPNLAGQYPEVVAKQLLDYRRGDRASAIMQALAARLSDRDIADLAAYYAYLPKARVAPTFYSDDLPALVRVGDPLRNIAPCISCHGGVDQKLGAPWLEGMPRDYLVLQLQAFASGARHNDSHAQMRNMARAMAPQEVEAVARFYAGRAAPGEPRR